MEKWETGNGNIRCNKVAMNLAMNINETMHNNTCIYTQNNGITFSNKVMAEVTSKMDLKFSHYSTSLCSVVKTDFTGIRLHIFWNHKLCA